MTKKEFLEIYEDVKKKYEKDKKIFEPAFPKLKNLFRKLEDVFDVEEQEILFNYKYTGMSMGGTELCIEITPSNNKFSIHKILKFLCTMLDSKYKIEYEDGTSPISKTYFYQITIQLYKNNQYSTFQKLSEITNNDNILN
jgi:hypothetical protein